MPKVKMTVLHTVRQTVVVDWPKDEMADFNYENALCNADFQETMPCDVVESELAGVWVDGDRHFF